MHKVCLHLDNDLLFCPSSRMSPPQNIDMSFFQQDLLIGGMEVAESCSDLGVTHIVTVDNVVPETASYSSVVKAIVFISPIMSSFDIKRWYRRF